MKILMRQREFAKRHHVSAAYVGKLIKQGRLPKLPDRRLDVEVCDAIMARIRKHSRARR